MGSAARQISEQEVDIVTFFEPRFTALSNHLLEIIYTDPSVAPSTRLLLFIARFSTGYLKPEVIMKESFILDNTGMSRSSLYKAKHDLIAAGKITISHTKTGHCIYRLAAELQCLKGASAPSTAAEKARHRWGGSAFGDHTRPPSETPMYKEKKKTLNENHQQSAQSADPLQPNDVEFLQDLSNRHSQSSAEVDGDFEEQIKALEKTWTTPPSSEEIQPQKSSAAPVEPNSEQCALARQLHQAGVNWRFALRLTREHDGELIRRSLANLKDRANIKHPAGWLVEEIRSGGYSPAAPSPDLLIKQAHQALAEKRQLERSQAEIDRDQSNQKHQAFWVRYEQMPPEQRQTLINQARQRLAKLSPKMAQAPLDSIPLRAMILEVAQNAGIEANRDG